MEPVEDEGRITETIANLNLHEGSNRRLKQGLTVSTNPFDEFDDAPEDDFAPGQPAAATSCTAGSGPPRGQSTILAEAEKPSSRGGGHSESDLEPSGRDNDFEEIEIEPCRVDEAGSPAWQRRESSDPAWFGGGTSALAGLPVQGGEDVLLLKISDLISLLDPARRDTFYTAEIGQASREAVQRAGFLEVSRVLREELVVDGESDMASTIDVRELLLGPPLFFGHFVVEDVMRASADLSREKAASPKRHGASFGSVMSYVRGSGKADVIRGETLLGSRRLRKAAQVVSDPNKCKVNSKTLLGSRRLAEIGRILSTKPTGDERIEEASKFTHDLLDDDNGTGTGAS